MSVSPAPNSAQTLAAIRERHVPDPAYDPPYCDYCSEADTEWAWQWPCDTRVVLDALDEAEAKALNEGAAIGATMYAADLRAARALADELAEALRRQASRFDEDGACFCSSPPCARRGDCGRARAALAKWEASHAK